MAEVYLTSDLHLGHEKAAFYRGFLSVEEHDNTIIHNFNKRVSKKDTVYILGDVLFSKAKNSKKLLELNGVKRLILGNHDPENIISIPEFIHSFTKIMAYFEYKDYILSHIPIHESQINNRYSGMFNVHGHIHNSSDPKHFQIMDLRYININCEFTAYSPLHISELNSIAAERKNAIR